MAKHHSHIISREIIEKLALSETFYKNESGYPTPQNLTKGYYGRNEDITQEAINYAGDSQGDAGVIGSSHGLLSIPQGTHGRKYFISNFSGSNA